MQGRCWSRQTSSSGGSGGGGSGGGGAWQRQAPPPPPPPARTQLALVCDGQEADFVQGIRRVGDELTKENVLRRRASTLGGRVGGGARQAAGVYVAARQEQQPQHSAAQRGTPLQQSEWYLRHRHHGNGMSTQSKAQRDLLTEMHCIVLWKNIRYL